MTLKQKILRSLYPLIMRLTKAGGKGRILFNKNKAVPLLSFYTLQTTTIQNEALEFMRWKGKKVLLVNTASECGFTAQLGELQKLYQMFEDKLVVLAFPSNDFREQEKREGAEIAQFCQVNYGITFPLMKKCRVKKGAGQDLVYQWLTHAAQNGWNSHQPDWNFSKFLVNEQGVLTHYFGPGISPLSVELLSAIKETVQEKQVLV